MYWPADVAMSAAYGACRETSDWTANLSVRLSDRLRNATLQSQVAHASPASHRAKRKYGAHGTHGKASSAVLLEVLPEGDENNKSELQRLLEESAKSVLTLA